jgi:hypothetical protein
MSIHKRPSRRGKKHDKFAVKIKINGESKWVGTYDTYAEAQKEEAKALLSTPRRKGRMPTVGEFAGAEFRDNGTIRMVWPDGERCQKDTGRRASSVRRLRDGLRPFLREFKDRRMDSFGRDEAITWTLPKNANIQQAVRQFFNHKKSVREARSEQEETSY